ncbi:MAG TPA: hypothetical protein VGM68_12065 [Rhizomicrobium sp.]|jgi:hypothetical protein
METGALSAPPRLLERLVFHAFPPAVREAVAGDLCELYKSPLQYLRSAAGALPFVIASQIRRIANLPVLIMQGCIIFLLLGGVSESARATTLAGNVALTCLLLFLFLMIGVYRAGVVPSAKWAILEALIVAAGVLAFARGVMTSLHTSHKLSSDQPAWLLFLWVILPFGMPLLGGLRAAMVLAREHQCNPFMSRMSAPEIAVAYDDFAMRIRRRNRIDMALLLALVVLSVLLLAFLPAHRAALGLTILYPVSAAYLFLHGAARPRAEKENFSTLRAFCRREILRQGQLRSFLLWLLPAPFAPLFLAEASVSVTLAGIALAFAFFLIWAADRERDAHLCSLTESLSQMQERRTA